MGIFRKSSKDPFPLEFLFEQWKNSSGQLSILKLAVNAPPDMFNFAQTSRKIDAEGLPTVGTYFTEISKEFSINEKFSW